MSPELFWRVLSLCVALASVETLHGIARTVLLVPRIGKAQAQRLGIVTGSLLALGVCAWGVPGMGLNSLAGHLLLGGVLALFMAAFDAALGRWLLRRPWARVAQDFNPASGNWLLLGLLLLAGMPAAVGWWRGAWGT